MKKQTNDGLVGNIDEALTKMPTVGKWQRDFLGILFSSILLNGKMNYSSLARHRELDEKTYRRGLRREFDFASFNFHGVAQRAEQGDLVAARDASFIAKSGKKTCGLGKFYSGCVGKTVKGLELSDLALSDRSRHQAFSFSTQQTVDELGKTRLALYAEQVTACAANLPEEVEYLLVDGYSKKHFVDSVGALERDLKRGGQLRCDANLRYFYRGAYSGKGGPKRYDGKVDFGDLSRFIYEGEAHKDVHLYAQTLWPVGLKRTIRVVLLLNTRKDEPRYILLFSTDLTLAAKQLLELYRLRFHIEFLVRDAKQFTGLTDCQASDEQALPCHFNAAMSAVNLAKLDLLAQPNRDPTFVFSLRSYIHQAFSHRLLFRLLASLDLDLSCSNVQRAFNHALAFGLAAP